MLLKHNLENQVEMLRGKKDKKDEMSGIMKQLRG